jgi:signal transduction histidine kinase
MSVIRLPVTVDQIFTNIILASTFTILLGLAMLLFESLVIAIVTVINQKTEQTQALNAQLAASNLKLEEMANLKDNFLSMVSHDIRAPLTGVLAYAYMIRDEGRNLNEADRRRYLDIIIDQGNRLNRLVDDLLDVQSFEAGKMSLDFLDLDLNGLVREAVETFKAAADLRGTNIMVSLPPGPLMVPGSPDRLFQAMSNLLSNALKFTPSHGSIEVRVETVGGTDGPRATVSVKDNGPGIPPEFQDRLFEKFSRGDVSVQGTGLGLALVKEIVEAHRGRVGAQSEPGQGSLFFFTLPLARP